jgi:hypothetical protein
MEDFSLVNVDMDFLDGPYVCIEDEKNDSYALEFYEKFGDDWAIVWSSENWLPYHWFRHNKKFRNTWKIKVWGWEDDSPKLLMSNTYSEEGKNVCLELVHDSYSTNKKWTEMSLDFSKSNRCKIFIVSKFSDRLKKEFSDTDIIFLSPVHKWEEFFSRFNIYSKFKISKTDIQSRTESWWESEMIFENHANPVKSWDIRTDWTGLSDIEIFNNIMGI